MTQMISNSSTCKFLTEKQNTHTRKRKRERKRREYKILDQIVFSILTEFGWKMVLNGVFCLA